MWVWQFDVPPSCHRAQRGGGARIVYGRCRALATLAVIEGLTVREAAVTARVAVAGLRESFWALQGLRIHLEYFYP